MRKMKDSGIEWIGEIPEDWDIGRIGELYTERKTKVSDLDFQPLSVTMKGIVPQLANAAKSDAHDDRKLVKKGDFAINSRSDRRGSCGISAYDGSVSLINTILTPRKNMNPNFYNWLFHTSLFADEFYKWGHGIVDDLWTTNWSDMKNISIPLPLISEQQQIADFLDEKVSQIDSTISKTRKSIEEYKKLKQSIITEVVTGKVKIENGKVCGKYDIYKDSGIEWIGEIPEEWECFYLSQIFTPVKNKNIGLIENNLLSLSYGKIIRKNIETTFGLLPENFEGYNIIQENDIVLRLTDLQNDHKSLRVGIAKEKGIITSAYLTLRNQTNKIAKYFYYLLHSFDIAKGFYGMGAGVRQGLNWNEVRSLRMIAPKDISEQQQIADYLDQKCSEIDKLITKKEQLVVELEAYKKSLIYEVVTGKKEMC